jgi:hypothetical protein
MNSLAHLKGITPTVLVATALALVHSAAFASPDGNTSFGVGALPGNTTGGSNSAFGHQALNKNSSGRSNTAVGDGVLARNTTGEDNIALGGDAGANIFTGSNNIDIGSYGSGDESDTIRIGGSQNRTFMGGIDAIRKKSG